jgi:hypothetical protein
MHDMTPPSDPLIANAPEAAREVRAVVSPLANMLMTVTEMFDVPETRAIAPWHQTLHRRAHELDVEALRLLGNARREFPDFLLPLPIGARPTFEQEIERLRATPDELVRDQAERDGVAALRPFVEEPRAALERHCRILRRCWNVVFAPSWPQMRRAIEREILLLGRTLATEGLESTLQRLHPRLRWARSAASHPATNGLRIVRAEGLVVLAPLVCRPDSLLTNDTEPDTTAICYPARGALELWGRPASASHDQLAALLGAPRARIVRALALPASTLELGERLFMAPSTVSHHLKWLAEVGLVDRARLGYHVYYALTARGEALLALF